MDEWIGKQIDDMIVLELDHITKNHVKYYRVRCVKCNNEKLIQMPRLKRHENTKHDNRKYYLPEYDENIGLTINDYTIIKRLDILKEVMGLLILNVQIICQKINI